MKISLGMNLRHGAWGGGNQFGLSLSNFLRKKGCEVTHNLKNPDLDIIILTEPRTNLESSAYSHENILDYLNYRNPRAIVVHRINECDERKGTKGLNELLIEANKYADHTVFVASWLQKLFLDCGIECESQSVILNGSDSTLFNSNRYSKWDYQFPIKIISHHWGGNWLKGFDIYEKLDKMLGQPKWKERIKYMYVGNLPEGFQFRNTNYIPPKHGKELSDILSSSHVYLTASRNEPGGHHQNEGANCGLPLLYIESGCMPEYCNGFGISFNQVNFEDKLHEMINTYDHWADKMPNYPHTAEKMCSEYFSLFQELLDSRKEIISRRRPIPRPSLTERTAYHLNDLTVGMKRTARKTARKIMGKV